MATTHTHTHTVRPGEPEGWAHLLGVSRMGPGWLNHLALSDHKFGSLFRNFSAVILEPAGRHWGALVRWGLE